MKRVLVIAAALAGVVAVPGARAQKPLPPLARALDLERRGSYAAAADAYAGVLTTTPADPVALLGLERALEPLNRTAEVIPRARAALAVNSALFAAHSVLVRSWIAVGPADSVGPAVDRWARAAPGDESPYREWAVGLSVHGSRAAAKAAITLARQRLGRADVLASEAAQVASAERDWSGAVTEWLAAIRQMPGFRYTALSALAPAAPAEQPTILRDLQRDASTEGRMLAATLLARWGDPVGGFRILSPALPADNVQAVERLNQFVEQLQAGGAAADARRAEGMALEASAFRLSGASASRARVLAARAYSDAGDREAARRMLTDVADGRTSGSASSTDARTTLIGVLADEGKADEAERQLNAAKKAISTDEYASLNRRVAWGVARNGQLDRAEQLLKADSTVEGFAVSGRIALLRGDIRGAADRLRAAGPYAGTREEIAARATWLSLLQRIEADTMPALGRALLKLERGDSAGATRALEQVAGTLAPDQGGAELRLWTGRIELARGRKSEAERLFREAATEAAPATAPAAELELGRLLIALGRRDDAVQTLEHMILTYSSSALVPQARRALDEAKGAIPRT